MFTLVAQLGLDLESSVKYPIIIVSHAYVVQMEKCHYTCYNNAWILQINHFLFSLHTGMHPSKPQAVPYVLTTLDSVDRSSSTKLCCGNNSCLMSYKNLTPIQNNSPYPHTDISCMKVILSCSRIASYSSFYR